MVVYAANELLRFKQINIKLRSIPRGINKKSANAIEKHLCVGNPPLVFEVIVAGVSIAVGAAAQVTVLVVSVVGRGR